MSCELADRKQLILSTLRRQAMSEPLCSNTDLPVISDPPTPTTLANPVDSAAMVLNASVSPSRARKRRRILEVENNIEDPEVSTIDCHLLTSSFTTDSIENDVPGQPAHQHKGGSSHRRQLQHLKVALHLRDSCNPMDLVAGSTRDQPPTNLVRNKRAVLESMVGAETSAIVDCNKPDPPFPKGEDPVGAFGRREESLGEPSLSTEEASSDDSKSTEAMSTPIYGVAPNPDSCSNDMHPDSFLKEIIRAHLGFYPKDLAALSLPSPGFFPEITDEDMAAYNTEIVAAVRENDLDTVRIYYEHGRTLACCNRFGESLMHMACRRGYGDIVSFFLNEGGVNVRIRDDCGRTPLHDACWHRKCQYEIVDSIIRLDPSLLCISDKRGHTPFAYARREDWANWRQFLSKRTKWIVAGFALEEVQQSFGNAAASTDIVSGKKALN